METLLIERKGEGKITNNPIRIDLRKPENRVNSWKEFVDRYKHDIEHLNIQLERAENYQRYKDLTKAWKDLNIESWFLVKEILHRKKCILIENDFPPVALPKGVKVYTFWINKYELSEAEGNTENYKILLESELEKLGYCIESSIYYMRDQSQMSIPQYPHFHVYTPPLN